MNEWLDWFVFCFKNSPMVRIIWTIWFIFLLIIIITGDHITAIRGILFAFTSSFLGFLYWKSRY